MHEFRAEQGPRSARREACRDAIAGVSAQSRGARAAALDERQESVLSRLLSDRSLGERAHAWKSAEFKRIEEHSRLRAKSLFG